MIQTLSGKLALVTGASRGIGAATAIALGKRGAHVILTARTTGGLEDVEDAIHRVGGTATIAPLDLAENDSIARLAEAIAGRWARLDVMVLNAAMLGTLAPVAAIDAKEFARVLTLNVMAQQQLIAAFDPLLRASDNASVFGVTSSVGAKARPYWGAYGASKAALDTMLLAYGQEVANISKIRVAIIDPGATATKMREQAFPGEDQSTLKSPDAVADAIAELTETGFESGSRTRVEA
ncbi:SDR family NAD(P)-dependent oxidoreductase [Sphingomonas montanisoli]|uniref:SDR family NAD(P)-dependent oxidoreductase n=1 Tax=Sphingomonas montanisoli TaxID=2606412 RepID=A0A5D9CBJ3_9SPHN|nr:SDR family NAD(P)-dependent oxidoreductase [Sphingomonas montanisoli]TZG28667.1 SDR family NAD(P)-dependent oxidoreductase [Sphingomonas montanisoli]